MMMMHWEQWRGLTPPQIEDDAQENEVNEDAMSDIRSPGTDDIVSPASHDSRAKVWRCPSSFAHRFV
jgi:hypothetical protein